MFSPRMGVTASSSSSNISSTAQKTPPLAPTPQTDPQPWRKKILVAGFTKTGKTSAHRVVFHRIHPKDSFFIDSNSSIGKEDIDSLVALQFLDCPGNTPLDAIGCPVAHLSSILFFLDIHQQDGYDYPISQLVNLIISAWTINFNIKIDVFIHKAEGLSEDFKMDSYRQVSTRVFEDLVDSQLSETIPYSTLKSAPINFYLTSIFDTTIFEGYSRIIQRVIVQLPSLENLLNAMCANSGIAKAFLFDIRYSIYLATDASPVDSATLSLCCDYVQTLSQFAELYKNIEPVAPVKKAPVTVPLSPSTPPERTPPQPTPHPRPPRLPSHSPPPSRGSSSKESTPSPLRASAARSDSRSGRASSRTNSYYSSVLQPQSDSESEDSGHGVDARQWASSAARLAPDSTVAYWQITDDLALVALVRTDTYEAHKGLVEYNVTFFRSAIHKIMEIEMERRRAVSSTVSPTSIPSSPAIATAGRKNSSYGTFT